jgi:hypothetical protein
MTNKASISFNAKSNITAGLKLEMMLDGVLIDSIDLTENTQSWIWHFDDACAEHQFEIVLSNKLPHHTVLDQDNQIIQDVVAEIFDVKISDIDLGPVFYHHSLYYHNSNGWSKPVVTQFFRSLGCNGLVKFNFTTPAYAWLMENI